jgi:monoamine oxidase
MASDAVLERLAREILMVDERGNSLNEQYSQTLEKGLPKLPPDAERRDVIVLGAGIAGLVAGKLLKDAGYNVTILEANDGRVGGRVKTFHTSEGGEPAFKDPKQYAEAGAMRIPTTHPLVNKVIDLMGLRSKVQPFYNVDVLKADPSKQANRTWLKTNGVEVRQYQYNTGDLPPQLTSVGFPLPEALRNQTASALLNDALALPNKLVDKSLPLDKQIEGWKEVLAKYDEYSMRQYLREYYQDEHVIEYIGTLKNLTSRMFLSFIHNFIDTFYINSETSYIELAGGNWRLPQSFVPYLAEDLVMNARAIELGWFNPHTGVGDPRAMHRGKPGVWVKTVNEPAVKRGVARPQHIRVEREFTADFLVVTIPFSALRFVKVSPLFSYDKRRAIIELHYDQATKVLLEFSERFWEWDEATWRARLGSPYRGHDSLGGGSIVDGPNRFIYYPSHPVPGSTGGVILASYTWADEACRWDSMPDEDRYGFALKGLTDIYGPEIKKFFTGAGRTQSWLRDHYSFGEAAVFTPGQLTTLHPHIPTPEGLVHFAGEHTSLKHAWIEGAIESAVRVALEISRREGAVKSGSST